MRVRLAMTVLVGYCAISCIGDDPAPQDLVTYTLEIDQETWLFASDAEGNVLDSKQLVFNEPVTLRASDPVEIFSLTLIRRLIPNVAVLNIFTYTGMSPGAEFVPGIYQPDGADRLDSSGKSTVRVTNYPLAQALPLIVSDPWQSISYNRTGFATPTFAMDVWQSQQPRFLFSAYQDDLLHPVYTLVDPVDVGATLSADFTTFLPFEKTIEIKGFDTPLEGKVTFQLYGYSAGDVVNGYKMANLEWTYNGTSPVAKVGYLDDFKDYYMNLWVYEIDRPTKLKKSLNYTHFGPINKSIQFFDDDLTVSNTTMSAFAFEFSGEYHMRSHRFGNQTNLTNIDWVIYSGPGVASLIAEVPSDLLKKYPDLTLTDMQYSSSSFYTFDDGFDYGKILDEKFKISFGPEHPCYVQKFMK